MKLRPISIALMLICANFAHSAASSSSSATEINWNERFLVACATGNVTQLEEILANHGSTLDINVQNDVGNTGLMLATEFGHIDVFPILISAYVDLNIENNAHETALIIAVKQRNAEMVQVLIEAKADPNPHDAYGFTALMHAVRHGYTEIARTIISAEETNVNAHDLFQWTAILLAARYGHVGILDKPMPILIAQT